MITKPQIDSILRAVRGRPFQFDFSEIVIRGQADFDDPYFKGPGIVSGDIDGPLKFSMFDQLGNPTGSAAITRAILAKEPMRFFGTDMDGLDWAGGYFFPAARYSTGGQHKISGELKQLSTGISQQVLPQYKNTTALYYSENLSLPMVDAARTQIVRNGFVEMQSARADRTILEEDGFHIVFKQDLETDHTQVIMRNRPELMPPIAEIALAEAIIYLTGRACRPRLTARYFEDRAQLFIRDTSTLPRTGLPGPLRGSPQEIHAIWKILYAFLKQYFHRAEFDSPELSKLIEEVIRSSVGTVHSFMAALLLGIENLMEKIIPLQQTATQQELSELRSHIQQWNGAEHIRNRALSLISMAAKSSVHQSLKQLRDCAVVTKEQAVIWDELRQKVAHGRIVDYSDAQLWERHATLITMFHRLVLRLIGYKGPMTDFAAEETPTIDFNWTQS